MKKLTELLVLSDIRLVELFFGIQAAATSILSLIVEDLQPRTVLFLWINGIVAIPQVWSAIANQIAWRHYTNALSFISSMGVSVSLVNQPSNEIAIFGYAGLAVATLFCSVRTHLDIQTLTKREGK